MSTRLSTIPSYQRSIQASRAKSPVKQKASSRSLSSLEFYTSSLENLSAETSSTITLRRPQQLDEDSQITPKASKQSIELSGFLLSSSLNSSLQPQRPTSPISAILSISSLSIFTSTSLSASAIVSKLNKIMESVSIFHGRKDGYEDSTEYLETINFVVEEKYF